MTYFSKIALLASIAPLYFDDSDIDAALECLEVS